MAFDEAGYRKYAKENNFDPDEVEKEIAYQKQGSGDFKKDQQGFTLNSPEKLNKDLGNDWWHLPAAVAVGGLGLKAIQSGMGMLKPQAPVAPPAIDPTFDAGIAPPEQPTTPSLDDQIKMERLKQAQLKTAQLEKASQPKPAGTPVAAADSVANVAPDLAPKPAPTLEDLQARAAQIREAMAAQKAATTPPVQAALEKAAPQPVAQPVAETVVEGAVAPKTRAPKTQKTFKSAADIPEGFVFRPDVGNLDRSMGNILGKEHREYARELFSGGKPFGHSDDLNKDVSRLTTEYFKRLQQEVPETILSREARIAQKVPSEFGTFAKGTNFGKAAKVAGVAGTLIAIADLANAKTPEQKATAGTNLLGAVLPPFMDVNDVGAPTIGQDRFENAYKLGSPYAQTEEAKKARLKEKAGAGRGIAPPSAYMR